MNQPWLNLQAPPPPPRWHHLRQHHHLLFFLDRQQQQQSPTTLLTTTSISSSSNRGGRVNHGVVGIGLRPSAKQTAASLTPSGISLSFEEDEDEDEDEDERGSELHNGQSARERREMRKLKRSSTPSYNWREELEDRLLVKKPKKPSTSWMSKLTADSLTPLGPQWWLLRVTNQEHTAGLLARSIVRNYPDLPFKVYNPAVKMKQKMRNGSVSVKPKFLYPGFMFLHCVLNQDIHDFIRATYGIRGFVGTRMGNRKRQFIRPQIVAADQIDLMLSRAREEQEIADREFEEKYPSKESCDGDSQPDGAKHAKSERKGTRTKRRTRKASAASNDNPPAMQLNESLASGSTVRILSGPFMDFTGSLKELNRKTGKATVKFTLFGKESFAELDADQIVADIASP